MTRNYKTNWQGKRTSTRFPVTFDAPKIASEIVEACTICGGKIEEVPMMRGVCYSCYQNITKSPEALTAYRNHAACLLAETMRDCGNCKFQPVVLDVTAPKDEVKFGNVIFDIPAIAENIRTRSAELKSRIDDRMISARERMGQRH